MSWRHRTVRSSLVPIAGVGAAALVLAACGSSSTSAPSTSAPASSAASSATASTAASAPASASAVPSASASDPTDQLGIIDPATLPVTIPFTDVASHIVVDAGFGTDQRFPMMLDTGAPLNVSEDIVTTFGLPVMGKTTGEAAGGTIESNQIAAESVTVGDLTVKQLFGISPWVGSDNPLSCVTENGLLGANVMRHGVWQIDYQAKTVTVTESTDGIDHVTGAIKVPLQKMAGLGGSPSTAIGLGSNGLPFLIDTGSPLGIVAGEKDLASIGIEFGPDAPRQKAILVGAGGGQEREIPYATTTLDVWGTKYDYPVGALDVTPGTGNIGNAFLSQFVVTFDFPNNTMYLDPVSTDGTLVNPPIQGASIGWDGKTAIVSTVAVGSDADKAGLKLGDVVTAVDGTPITSHAEFCTALNNPDIKTITTKAGDFDASVVEDFFTVK